MTKTRSALILTAGVFVLFILGRFLGSSLGVNTWSFTHWQFLPQAWPAGWFAVMALLATTLILFPEKPAQILTSRSGIIGGAIALGVLLVLFHSDSVVFGGGNLKVAQVSQVPTTVLRWFEFGTAVRVSTVYGILSGGNLKADTAAIYAWQSCSLIASFLTIVALLLLAREVTENRIKRLVFFLTAFFGPQLLVMFGTVGFEPTFVAVAAWYAYVTARHGRLGSWRSLGWVLAIQIVGLVLHVSAAVLLPATIFLLVRQLVGSENRGRLALTVGLVSIGIGVIVLYYVVSTNFYFSQFFLFLKGKRPLADYSLFSLRHISDVVQLFFLVFPAILIQKLLFFRHGWTRTDSPLFNTMTLAAVAGGVLIFLSDPSDTIVLDVPHLSAFMFPSILVLAWLLTRLDTSHFGGRALMGAAAVLVIMAPASVLPTYLRIDQADPYAHAYYETNELYFLSGSIAFRDAYFAKKDLDPANRWEWDMPIKSSDYLDFQGIGNLIVDGQDDDAMTLLYRLVSKRPYWIQPRSTLIGLLLKQGNIEMARPHIDTALMLAPYDREIRMNDYLALRDAKRYLEALRAVDETAEIFPNNEGVAVDRMIINYYAGEYTIAANLADSLIAGDATRPQPYMIKGMLAERERDANTALANYRKFLSREPNSSDAELVRGRIDRILEILKQRQSGN